MRKLREAGRLVLVKEWSAIRLAALVKGKRMTQKEAPFDTFIQGEGDTAQEAVQEEIPSSSPPLPPHYAPHPHYPIAAYSLSSPSPFLSV